jgi:hypothetical protein
MVASSRKAGLSFQGEESINSVHGPEFSIVLPMFVLPRTRDSVWAGRKDRIRSGYTGAVHFARIANHEGIHFAIRARRTAPPRALSTEPAAQRQSESMAPSPPTPPRGWPPDRRFPHGCAFPSRRRGNNRCSVRRIARGECRREFPVRDRWTSPFGRFAWSERQIP